MRTNRRHVLKILGVAPIAAAGQTQVPPAPTYAPKSFSVLEWRTVRVLADLIIPADDRSGSATDAGVPEFIDELVWVRKGNLETQLRGGLAWLNRESNRLDERDFPDCTPAQQMEILDRIACPAKATPETSQAVAFFNTFRDLTAGGFYTSKIGIADLGYMGNTAVDHWDGCPPEVLKRFGLV